MDKFHCALGLYNCTNSSVRKSKQLKQVLAQLLGIKEKTSTSGENHLKTRIKWVLGVLDWVPITHRVLKSGPFYFQVGFGSFSLAQTWTLLSLKRKVELGFKGDYHPSLNFPNQKLPDQESPSIPSFSDPHRWKIGPNQR